MKWTNLLGSPNIKTQDIINCKTTDTQVVDRAAECNTNTAKCQGSRCKQHYTTLMSEAGRPKRYYTNTDNISKSNKKDKPMVTDNVNSQINYYLPGPNQDNEKKMSA